MTLLVVGAVGAVTTWLALAALRPVLAARAMDLPSARSSHSTPVPRAGGVGVVAGALVATAVAYAVDREASALVLVALVVLGLVGLAEDLGGVPIRIRLLAQLGAATALVAVLGAAELGPIALAPLLVLGLVGYCNAFNFMDGINGISGLVALVTLGWYALVADSVGADAVLVTCVLLAGAVLGFLPWNVPRARLFLGDTGSYSLGIGLPTLALLLRVEGASWPAVLAPLLIYLVDVGWTLLHRLLRGERVLLAHREHVYQHVSLRLGHLATSALVAGFTAAVCLAWWVLEPALVATVACWALLLAAYLSQLRWWSADR